MAATALDLCTLAWSDQQGYVSISVRNPQLDKKDPGYWNDLTFSWPAERHKVATILDKAKRTKKDVYWAPAVFTEPKRDARKVQEMRTLYADLDEIDPHSLPKSLKPTAAWESSPGRWQALWSLDTPLRPQAQQDLNKMLTYAIGADKGGWDLTQVLRTPGTQNHKYKSLPRVKMLWLNGHTLSPAQVIDDLPTVPTTTDDGVELPDPLLILRRYRQRMNARTKTLLKARYAKVGTRSERLWELECLLAEAGLKDLEIASVCQATVWNKFKGRHDEILRLLTEAKKAIVHAGHDDVREVIDESEEEVFEDEEEIQPQSWSVFDREHEAIRWLVADIWGEGEVGFISGLPKAYKSWIALDLGVSISTGTRFLNVFQTRHHPVLLIQEEDPKPILQDRLVKIAASKGLIDVSTNFTQQTMSLTYNLPDDLHIISNQGFTLDEEWLDRLEGWIEEFKIKVVILDPLMMIAGGSFDEFKAFEFMEKVLKPLKRVRRNTGAAIVLVHHHIKGSTAGGARDMYGSVALWAWEEAALHLAVSGVGRVTAERFSKHSLLAPIQIAIGELSEQWSPTVDQSDSSPEGLLDALATMEGGATAKELSMLLGLETNVIRQKMNAFVKQEKVTANGKRQEGPGRPQTIWKVVK